LIPSNALGKFRMKWGYFFLLPSLIVIVISALVYMHQDKATIIKTPPKELAQWYKPANKRHVWLHNMFKLRREMQAVKFYAENQDSAHLAKWASQLHDHYFKIGEMVPSWNKKLDLATVALLKSSADDLNYSSVLTSVDTLQQNCDSCHNDYQAITALTYRAPDFSKIEHNKQHIRNHMKTLGEQVNQIKIASEDGNKALATSSLMQLKQGMSELGSICLDCHKLDKKTYPSEAMEETMLSLEQNLASGTVKAQAMDLGMLAVQACATCHGTHRLAFGVKQLLSKDPSLAELLKH